MIQVSNEENGSMSDQHISDETSNLLFAGTDTTSTTLTYVFWELANHPDLQEKLYAELEKVPRQDRFRIPSFKDIATLPLLDATINEILRVHPAAPSSMMRITPHGGGVVGGVFIPGGTVVSMQCYTTHRDPKVFPDPDRFDPRRWMDVGDDTLERMKDLFMPFSKGTRNCIGQAMAVMVLKLTTVALVKEFKVRKADGMSGEDMEMKDHFLAFPKGKRCLLVFEKRG